MKCNKKVTHLLIIFSISLILCIIIFKNIKIGEFLFIHDEFLSISKQESYNLFFTRSLVDLGSPNTIILIVTFFERLYYAIVYNFGLSLEIAQKILYFLKIFILLFLPYLGFRKLSSLFLVKNNNDITFIISLWYSFNTFTLLYWNGLSFPLTVLICYAIAPLALYYYHQAIFENKNYTDKIKTALLFFLMSFALYLFVVFLIVIIIYTLLYALLNKIKIYITFKNILILMILYLPFLSIHFLVINDMFFNISKTTDVVDNGTYGLLQGGFLSPLLMWFSWAIYTYWEPRNILTFHEYFKSIPAILAPFIIYSLIIYGIIKKKKNSHIIIFTFLFLLFLMFIKGGQKPFGDMYLFFIDNFSMFRVFRSPDNKFGFGIVFVLSMLLLIISSACKKKIFIGLLVAIIFIQGYPLFSGVAITGENTKVSSDRIIHITSDYQEVADFFNENSQSYSYIMVFPSLPFANYILNEGEKHVGQDLLPKLTALPFLYLFESSGMLLSTYEKLSQSLEVDNINGLKEFPIRYFMIRNDIDYNLHKKSDDNIKISLAKEFNLVFKNDLFEIYENPNALPIIKSNNIVFKMIDPVKYRILFKNIDSEQSLYFFQNYNSDWKLYLRPYKDDFQCDELKIRSFCGVKECNAERKNIELGDVAYVWQSNIFDASHKIYNDYANSWKISPDYIKKNYSPKYYKQNPDGSVDIELILYFKPQSYLYFGLIICTLAFLGYTVYLFHDWRKNEKFKESKRNLFQNKK